MWVKTCVNTRGIKDLGTTGGYEPQPACQCVPSTYLLERAKGIVWERRSAKVGMSGRGLFESEHTTAKVSTNK